MVGGIGGRANRGVVRKLFVANDGLRVGANEGGRAHTGGQMRDYLCLSEISSKWTTRESIRIVSHRPRATSTVSREHRQPTDDLADL